MEQFLEQLQSAALYLDLPRKRDERASILKKLMVICRNGIVLNTKQQDQFNPSLLATHAIDDGKQEGNTDADDSPILSVPLLFSEAKEGALSIVATMLDMYATLDDLAQMIADGAHAENQDENDEEALIADSIANNEGEEQEEQQRIAKKKMWWGYRALAKLDEQQKAATPSNSRVSAALISSCGVTSPHAIANIKSNFFAFFADIILIFTQHASVPEALSRGSVGGGEQHKKRRAENESNPHHDHHHRRVQVSLLEGGILLAIYESISMKLIEMEAPITQSVASASAKAIAVAHNNNNNNNNNGTSSYDKFTPAYSAAAAAHNLVLEGDSTVSGGTQMSAEESEAKGTLDLLVRFRGLVLLARALIVATTLNYGHSLTAIMGSSGGGAFSLPLSKNLSMRSSSSSTASSLNDVIRNLIADRERQKLKLLGIGDEEEEEEGCAAFLEPEDPETICALFTATDETRRRLIDMYRSATSTASAVHLVALQEELLVLLAGVEKDSEVLQKKQREAEEEKEKQREKEATEGDNEDDDNAAKTKKDEQEETSGTVLPASPAVKEGLRRAIIARLLHYRVYMNIIADIGNLVLSDMLHILVSNNCLVFSNQQQHDDGDDLTTSSAIKAALEAIGGNHSSSSSSFLATVSPADLNAFLQSDVARQRRILDRIVTPRMLLPLYSHAQDDANNLNAIEEKKTKSVFESALCPLVREVNPVIHFGLSSDYHRPVEGIIMAKRAEEEQEKNSGSSTVAIAFGLHPVASYIIDCLTRNVNDSLRILNEVAIETSNASPVETYRKMIVAIESETSATATASKEKKGEKEDDDNAATEEERGLEEGGGGGEKYLYFQSILDNSTTFISKVVTAASLFEIFSFASNPMAICALPSLMTFAYVIRPTQVPQLRCKKSNNNNNANLNDGINLVSFALLNPLRAVIGARLVALANRSVAAIQYIFGDYYSSQSNASSGGNKGDGVAAHDNGSDDDMSGSGRGCAALVRRLVADNTYQIGKEILSAQQESLQKNGPPAAQASFSFQPSLVNASVATSAFSHRSFVLFPAVFWALSVHSVLSFSIAWLIKTHHMQPVATQTAGRLQQMSNALYRLTESIRVDKVVTASAATTTAADEITDESDDDDDDDNNENDEEDSVNAEREEKSKAKKKKKNHIGANGSAALVTVAADDDTHNGERDGGLQSTATVVSAGLLKNLSGSLDAAFAASDTTSMNGFVYSTTATFLKGGLRGGRLIESSPSAAVVAGKKDAVTNLNVVAPYLALPFVGLWLAAGVTPSFASPAQSSSSSSIRTAIEELMRASLSALTQSYESSPDYAVHAANIAAAKAPKAHIYMTSAGKMTISAIVDTIIASLQRVKVQKSSLFVDYSNSEKRLKLKEVAESGVAIGADPSSLEVSAEGGSDTAEANRIKTAEDIAAITAAQKRANQSQPNLIKESEEAASAEPVFERSNRFRYLRTALSQYAQIHVIDTDPETPLNENLIAWLHTVGRNTAVRRAAYLAQRKEIRRMNALDGTDATNANAMLGSKGGKAGDLQQNAPLGQMIYRLRTGTLVIQKVKDTMNNIHPRARIHQAAFSSLLRGFHRLACSGGSEAALRQAQALVSRCLAHCPIQVRDRCEDMLCAYLNEAILDVHGRQKALALAAAAAVAASSSSSSSTTAAQGAATNALGPDDTGAKGKLSTSSSIASPSHYSDLAYRNLLAPSNQRSALALCLQCLYTAVAQSASARSASSEILMNSTAAAVSNSSSSSSGVGVLLHTHEDAAITPPVDPLKPLNWIITTAEEQSKAHATFMANAQRKQQQQAHTNDGLMIGSKRGRGGGTDSSIEITMTPSQSAALFETDEAKKGNRYSYLATRLLATMLHMHSGDGARGILSSLLTAPPSLGGSLLALPDSTLPSASASGATSAAQAALMGNIGGGGNRGDSSGNHPLPSRAFYDFFDACPMITNFMWTYWHCNACLNDERANLGMGVLAHIAQTRPAYRGRAIASLLYFSTIERRSARNAAIHHLNTFMTSRVTMDYMTVEERDAYLNIVVEFALKQCDTLSETVKAVGAAVENPNCPSDAAAAFASSGSGGAEDAEQTSAQISASPQPPVILTTQLSARLKNKYHLLSNEKIEALERVMTFAYDDPKQSVNAIADHQMVRLKLLQAWAASHAPASNSSSATHPLDAIRPEQAYLQTNEAAREIVDQNLSLLFAMCRIDARHAVTLVKKLLDIYSTFATITKAQAKAIEAITHFGPHAAAAAFAATRGAYAFAASEHAAPNTNLIHSLQRFFLGTSLCSAILYSADVDNVLRGLFGRVRSNSADIDFVNAPEKLKVDLSQQEIFATRLMPVIRQSPLASSDLVIKIMSVTASSVRLFMTEIAQLPYPLTHESHTKLSTIMTIIHTHCKFLFSNKSAVGSIAPPSIAPQKASFTTQLFGAAFGHSTPISRSTTTVVVPHPNNPALIAAGGQPQTHIIPTVSSAVLGTVVLANKRTFETAKASAQTFAYLAKEHPIIPCDIRMALPILGLVDRAELREVFVPAFVRFFAATEALRVPVEAPKADYFRNLMGAEQIPIPNASASATGPAGAGDSSSSSGLHRQLSAPCTFLSLMQGSAAIVDLTLQEVMWNLLVPCEVPQPPVVSAAGDEETAAPLNGTDHQHKNGKPQLLLNATNKRGLGTLDFITETMLVCNRVRRGGSASSSSASSATADTQHYNPQAIATNAKTTELLARYDHLLFGAANSVSISAGSRLVRMIVARRTRPTVCPLSPTAPCLKGSSSAALQLLNEILLMTSSSAAASENAFSWFDKKLGAGASAAAASASALSNAGLMVYGGVGNSGAGFMAKPQTQALLANGTTPATLASASAAAAMNKITPIAPFAVTVPQSLFLGSLDLFKTRLRHCPDVTVVAGGGGANAGGAHSALTTAYVDSRGIAVVQLVLEWAKGVTTRLTEVVVRLANRSPLDSAAAYLTQQITLHLAPETIAPAVAVAAVAGPTVNKILTTLTGRSTVTATAFPPLEPLLKAVDVSTLYDRLQRVPNILPSADVSRTVSPFWGGMPSDSFWLLYSSLHILAIKNDANYSEPVRERGVRALANIITDSCVATIIAASTASSVAGGGAINVSATNQQTSLVSNNNMSNATVAGAVPSAMGGEDVSSARPLESVMLAHWALLFSEEHWSRVEDHFLALPDKRLLEVLTARPKLQQAFLTAHEANPRHHHIVAQLHQQ